MAQPQSVRDWLCNLFKCHDDQVVIRWTVRGGRVSFSFTGDFAMGFDVGTKIAAAVQFLTSSGKPARVDGVPEWSVDDQNIVSDFAVASDGMSVTFTCATSGSTAVRVKADADLGSGVREVNGVGTLTVNEEEAATAEIVFTAVP